MMNIVQINVASLQNLEHAFQATVACNLQQFVDQRFGSERHCLMLNSCVMVLS